MNVSIKVLLASTAATSLLFLTGCASIVSGTHQTINVNTTPVANASCNLHNSKGRWFISRTPGSVKIHRAKSDLVIRCYKKRMQSRNQRFASNYNSASLGNVIAGGLIGAGVDAADGASYSYPDSVTVAMFKTHRHHKKS